MIYCALTFLWLGPQSVLRLLQQDHATAPFGCLTRRGLSDMTELGKVLRSQYGDALRRSGGGPSDFKVNAVTDYNTFCLQVSVCPNRTLFATTIYVILSSIIYKNWTRLTRRCYFSLFGSVRTYLLSYDLSLYLITYIYV